jgi:hypothetical protein
MELDWDGKVLWEHVEDAMHHDFCRLPNGNTMVLGWEPVPADMVPHIKGGQPDTEHEGHIWYDYFQVFRAYRYAPDFPGLQGKSLRPEEYTWMNHLYRGR